MGLNAHRVFENSTAYGSFHSAITVSPAQEDALRSARDDIRAALRVGMRDWSTVIEKAFLFDERLATLEPPALRPKFRMQGSFSYRTQVEPAQLPPQEIDLDDGLFLPVSFLTDRGGRHPVVASAGLFATVERVLGPLCEKNGWTLITDKPSCVRVEISDTAHVDIALYAIPDAQFAELLEEAALRKSAKGEVTTAAVIRDQLEFDEDLYRRISASEIMLAHRREGWKPSDPRKLDEWFQAAVDRHGQQIRRVAKYLKGWRDFQWLECRLSSIALMAAIVAEYDRHPAWFDQSRDDQAVLVVAQSLPAFLSGKIDNPVVPGQRLDEGWTPDMRNSFVARASQLGATLESAINRSISPSATLVLLGKEFGDRIPAREDLISGIAASSLGAPAGVRPRLEERERLVTNAVEETRARGGGTPPWST